jgi:hypothetical protein
MPLNQGRASRVTDLGDGTVQRVGGVPEREAQIMDHVRDTGSLFHVFTRCVPTH